MPAFRFNKDTQRRPIHVGLIVGFILNLINHGDEFFGGMNVELPKVWLTFLTPYCVSIYSLVSIKASKRNITTL